MTSHSALAADLGTATSFNAFVFGNATGYGGHADGAVAIGGNWEMEYLTTLASGNYGVIGSQNKIGAYVGGNLTVRNNPSINSGGNLYVKGTYSGGINMNGGGQIYVGSSYVDGTLFTAQKTYSLNQSASLNALTGKSIDFSDMNNWKVDVGTQSGSMKVVDINAADLAKNSTLSIQNMNSSDTLVINVKGSAVSGFGVTLNSNYKNKIIWNFADATTVNISDRSIHGTVLAPKATVNQYRNIDGNLIADSWNVYNSAEIHAGSSISFDGQLPSGQPATNLVPESNGSTLLAFGGMGIACAGLLMRRRKQLAA